MRPEYELYDRREFFKVVNKIAAILGLTAAAARNAPALKADSSNPFAYDLSRLQKTDPALLAYEEAARWRSPRKDPKRIALGSDDRVDLRAGNYVSVPSREGETILEIALSGPASCATAEGEKTFAAARDHLEVFDRKGERRVQWDSPGKKLQKKTERFPTSARVMNRERNLFEQCSGNNSEKESFDEKNYLRQEWRERPF